MSPAPLPGLDLDLDYPAAAPPAGLVDAARARGRLLRRRRRAAAGGAALLAGALLAGGYQWVQLTGAGSGGVRLGPGIDPAHATAVLPVSRGTGPDVAAFAAPGSGDGDPQGQEPYPGTVVTLGPNGVGGEVLTFTSRNGSLCLATRSSPSAEPQVSVCHRLVELPAEGIYWPSGYVDASAPGGDGTVTGYVLGIVRGPVDRVRLDLPSGPVDARLEPAPNPELGTLYSAGVQLRTDSHGVPLDQTWAARAVTVYRGDRPVFHCADITCPGGV